MSFDKGKYKVSQTTYKDPLLGRTKIVPLKIEKHPKNILEILLVRN